VRGTARCHERRDPYLERLLKALADRRRYPPTDQGDHGQRRQAKQKPTKREDGDMPPTPEGEIVANGCCHVGLPVASVNEKRARVKSVIADRNGDGPRAER
jgi:hypothetical protein